ncbi:ribonucleotide-diphosphate reductase subunit beta [Haloferax mediterranei ATCC 33500]|uniref:Ribonucleoside-diphosphate reductase n=1 Tax=Haloferax mediterranei (strain ATCC 33500 / DSM 1411 / JCM 8866 / NBRC 14739 / NCIMB 2177 / R-4) TaxID=523841 RepID=I3R0L5_HALMT|nr:ribonucleotide-diphosphate reductase subunit beta [Haloferax mediterranei]AFK17775.1 ribonucleoside-diphosphate reductase beta chain [Haloferax mediterranei ATCC 33500]AHZ22794.1 ribonucleoside-diphosphate reductase [Haloferax mediterranei ATCC 33500]EMA02953.1 ribonucleotide-diphosphate reductase subunit beta [Haloferax mediterranei ATCC 33500]MDX5987865.1 ribonucleotide-diphosphate reductase subunit beta [Haloferax mediterranei ATCC 33500]QCQ74341.1 ribonucleotide-diphosphate reductase su
MPIVNNDTQHDPNKILPIDYDWAREYYKQGVANNWVPEEVPMGDDVQQWKTGELTESERRLVEWNLGFFSTAESLTANNIVLAIYDHVTAPECRQYLLRQAYEEAIHTDTFIYCCDSLGFDPEYMYGMYDRIPTIEAKDEYVVSLTQAIDKDDFTIETDDDLRAFLRDLVGFYVIMEGIFFYAGFAMMLALKRRGKMVGVGEQFEYIMRDESLHLNFGIDLINTIRDENPGVWTDEFEAEVRELIVEAVDLERTYAHEACPPNVLGMSADQFAEYVEYVADRRLGQLRMGAEFGTDNPFPWMTEQVDLNKEKNFFETQVTEYQSGGQLNW